MWVEGVERSLKNSLSLPLPQACNFIKKETLAQVFSCEFCEVFKNTIFTEHLWTIASETMNRTGGFP